MDERRTRLRAIIDNLNVSCLLLECNEGGVKMHDVVRDFSISITSTVEYGFMVKNRRWLKEWPRVQNLSKVKWLSLMKSNITRFPNRIEHPELLSLLMQYNSGHLEVPDDFFAGMKELKVS